MQSSMLHGSETWRVRKENEVELQWAEMRMDRCMCDVNVKRGSDDIISVLQLNRLQWYGQVNASSGTG